MDMDDHQFKQKKTNKYLVGIMVAAVVFAVLLCAGKSYVNQYYHATDVALAALQGSGDVTVGETDDYYCFAPEQENGTGIIFYPGAKVEETAYAPMLLELAEYGYTVYLMRMPWRLAVLDKNAADSVIQMDSDTEWILMGHSLGGAMAAAYVSGHSEDVAGLVLLAAYSSSDLSDSGIPVLSIYGTNDGVLDLEKYETYWEHLPAGSTEFVIDGANHAGYGFYGEQEGDYTADITADEQQSTVVDEVVYWLQEE